MITVAVFDTHRFDREALELAAAHPGPAGAEEVAFRFVEARLGLATASLAAVTPKLV